MATSRKTLDILVTEIADLLNLATSKEQAIEKGQDKYLYLEYASVYGGYRLVNVGVSNGAHYRALGMSSTSARLKASEMETMLRGIITGIEAVQGQ